MAGDVRYQGYASRWGLAAAGIGAIVSVGLLVLRVPIGALIVGGFAAYAAYWFGFAMCWEATLAADGTLTFRTFRKEHRTSIYDVDRVELHANQGTRWWTVHVQGRKRVLTYSAGKPFVETLLSRNRSIETSGPPFSGFGT